MQGELKGYESRVSRGLKFAKEWMQGVDRVWSRLPPVYSMPDAAPWLLKLKDCKDCKDCIDVYIHYEVDDAKAAHALSLHNYHRKGTEAALHQQWVLLRSCQNE